MDQEPPEKANSEVLQHQPSSGVKTLIAITEIPFESHIKSVIESASDPCLSGGKAGWKAEEVEITRADFFSLGDADAVKRISVWIASGNYTRVFILYLNPISVILGSLSSSATVDRALSHWISETRQMVALYHNFRDCVTLVDVEAGLSNPTEFLQLLGLSSKVSLEPLESELVKRQTTVSPYEYLLAEYLLHSDFQAIAVAGELEACSFPLEWRPPYGQRELFDNRTEKVPNDFANASGNDDVVQLKRQIHHLQEEYEAQYFRAQALSRKLDSLTEEELEALRKTWAAKSNVSGQAMTDLQVSQLLDQIYQSTSWKITAPLRYAYDLMAGFLPKR